MAKRERPESFEQQEYGEDPQVVIFNKYSVICQIMEEMERTNPAQACRAKMLGGMLQVFYHVYEMNLPSKMRDVSERADKLLDEAVKHLKKEFKSRTGKVLDLSENKDLRNHTVQKTSLNERYYAVFTRVFDMG